MFPTKLKTIMPPRGATMPVRSDAFMMNGLELDSVDAVNAVLYGSLYSADPAEAAV